MRIQQPGEFRRTREVGQRLVRGCVILNWQAKPEATHSRLGVVTSRKLGGSVVRSRARRQLREAFRHLQHRIQPPCDVVMVARQSVNRMGGLEIRRQVQRAMLAARILGPVA